MRCAQWVVLVAACGTAHGQPCQPALFNGGFELTDPFFPQFPEGWGDIPPGGPRWRQVGDDPVHPPLVRSGSHSIELPTVGGQRFLAWTTNVFDPQGDLYDPTYIYLGGPLTVSGWYAIPASDPLVNARAGLKLELRREPPNFSIYLSFERLELQGHTGGQWRYFEFTITDEDIETLEAQWGGPWPPFPTSVSVLPLRFLDPEFSTQSGTIFWDDLRVLQIPNCPADLTGSGDPGSPSYGVPDGRVDIGDFFYFVDQFALRSSVADLTGSDDPQNPAYGVCDGVVDASDFFYYLELFSAGC